MILAQGLARKKVEVEHYIEISLWGEQSDPTDG